MTHSKIERVFDPRYRRPKLWLGEKNEEMGKRGELNNEQVVNAVKHLKDTGEDITIEQAEKMLESMQHLVTLAINQYFRKASGSKRNSSTK
ncbi:hypothetical protein SAMN04487996_1384 [Dyadobacter soli]|uniref:Uncharacterized protein n=2 Tax=Dyadobacter soli TaxID=659014 RepID=A0A1G8CHT8_9BACT|nr:hypothetical protein SAMN04487996_1384 [Dyadobacter soli]